MNSDKRYAPAQYGLGFSVPKELVGKKTIKHWRGGRFWNHVPRCLWSVLGRPYEMHSFADALRDARQRRDEEMARGLDR